jgi:hypothetical protein
MALRGSAAATWGRLVSSGSSLLRSVVTPSTQLAPVAESVNPTPALASTSGPRSWYSSIADLSPGTVDFATLSANKTEYQKILDDVRSPNRLPTCHLTPTHKTGPNTLFSPPPTALAPYKQTLSVERSDKSVLRRISGLPNCVNYVEALLFSEE